MANSKHIQSQNRKPCNMTVSGQCLQIDD